MSEICLGGVLGGFLSFFYGDIFCIQSYTIAGIILVLVGILFLVIDRFPGIGEFIPPIVSKLGMISIVLGLFLSIGIFLLKDIWFSSLFLRIFVYLIAFLWLLKVILIPDKKNG